jgi:protein O-GlcNAc transferase
MSINKQKDPSEEKIKIILNLFNLNKLNETKKEIDKEILKYPNSAILLNIQGAVFASNNQLDFAIESYSKAITINPGYAQVYNNLGIALYKLHRNNEAIDNYKRAISLKSNFSEAFNNLGNAIREIDKINNAIPYYERAITINPKYAEAYNNLGAAYRDLNNNSQAIKNYKSALKIKPNYSEAYYNLGGALRELNNSEESIACYKKAIKFKPNYEKAYDSLGNLFNDLGRYDEATNAYKEAIKIKPDFAMAYSNLLFNLNYKLDFNLDNYLLEANKFRLNCKSNINNLNNNYQYEKNPKKLKLGLVSADFGNHPGGFFTLGTLRELKKKNFELVAYATSNRNDELSHHFKSLFLKWNLVEKIGDEEIVKLINKDGIHILIDLQGHSAKNRLPIFIHKPAPIQASWLGQGSTGIPEINYFIGSPQITPKNEENHFVEKVIRLPEISQSFTAPDFNLEIKNLPALKNKFITFGCINKISKINEKVIELWSEILLSIPNSKLLLKNKNLDDKKIKENILSQFQKKKVNKERIITLGESKTREELLEAYNKIDISLDPFPFQGNTSTCESVWMGVPVLTMKGDRYLFHFGESINSNLKMNSWIAQNKKEYVLKAIEFSSNTDLLVELRKNLRKTALSSTVFDSLRLAKHFDKLLWLMWENFQNKELN